MPRKTHIRFSLLLPVALAMTLLPSLVGAADIFPTNPPVNSSPVEGSGSIFDSSTGGGLPSGGMCLASGSGNPTPGQCDSPPAAVASGQPSAAVGNPVNVMNGNKFQAETDLPALPGVLGLQLSRSYNSQSRARGLFGVGWRHAYEVSLLESPHAIQIIQADGRRLMFPKDASGGCVSVRPQDGRLEKTAQGWTWVWVNGRELAFEPKAPDTRYGRLISIRERRQPGQPLVSLRYGMDGELVSIRDPLGRALEIHTGRYGALQWPEVRVDSPMGRLLYRLDGEGNLLTVQRADGVQVGYYYEVWRQGGDRHNLTGRALWQPGLKQWQRQATWAYDEQDRAIFSEHAGGVEKVSLRYDSRPQPPLPGSPAHGREFETVLTNSLGRQTRYRWQPHGQEWRLLESRGAGCASCGEVNRRYGYDRSGRVVYEAVLLPDGHPRIVKRSVFDAQGRLINFNVAGDAAPTTVVRLRYEDVSHPERLTRAERPSVCAGRLAATGYKYDMQGLIQERRETGFTPDCKLLERTVKPMAPSAKLVYDARNLVLKALFPNGDALEFDRSWQTGRIQAITHRDAKGGRIAQYLFAYRATGEILRADFLPEADTAKVSWHYQYDYQARLVGVLRNGQLVSATGFDEAGRVAALISSDSGLTRWQRDTENRLQLRQRMGLKGYQERRYVWSPHGDLAAIRDGRGLGVSLTHSSDGRSMLVKDSLGRARKVSLAGDDVQLEILRLPAFGDGLLPADGVRLDRQVGENRLLHSQGSETRQGFDDWGRLAYLFTTGNGKIRYDYDEKDRLIGVSKPEGSEISYGYDAAGHRITRTVTGFIGTGQDRRAFHETTHWDYAGDRLSMIRHPGQTTRFRYDGSGRLIAREINLTGLKAPYITQYGYNRQGRVSVVTLPEGTQILGPSPDEFRLRPINHVAATSGMIASRRDAQQEPYYQLGNGLEVRYRYDAAGRWSGMSISRPGETEAVGGFLAKAFAGRVHDSVWEENWGYDLAGRLVGGQWEVWGQKSRYDALYDSNDHLLQLRELPGASARLKVSMDEARYHRYYYDATGNRLYSQESAGGKPSPQMAYRYQDERLESINSDGMEYDKAGQPVVYRQFSLAYQNGRLVQVWRGVGADRRLLASYDYNDLGQRIRKQVWLDEAGGKLAKPQISFYLYESGRLSHELYESGRIRRSYLYQGQTPLATLDYGKRGVKALAPGGWRWLAAVSVQWRIWRGVEEAPTVSFVHTDHTGLPRLVTDQKGEAVWRFRASPFGASGREQGKSGYRLALRYPGQYADAETGFSYNHYRYYDPSSGRYLTPDPLGRAGGENLYGYVNQSPLQFGDPEGLLLFAFDGTGNQDYFTTPDKVNAAFKVGVSDDQRNSNVVRFRNAYLGDPDEPVIDTQQIRVVNDADPDLPSPPPANWPFEHAYYISGAGTRDQYTGIQGSMLDAGTGGSMDNRSDMMVRYLENYLESLAASQKKAGAAAKVVHVPIDVIGFSRGATTARMFANQAVDTLKSEDWRQKLADNKVCVDWRFVGVWDTVPHHGLSQENDLEDLELAIPDEFVYAAHAVAMNEHRGGFSAVSIFRNPEEAGNVASGNDIRLKGKTRIERGFMGAHSDIGGGYAEGDLSDVGLMWMMREAGKAGVMFDEGMVKANGWDTVSNAVVHDSVGASPAPLVYFGPGRIIKYLDNKTAVKPFDASSLGLTWQKTLDFVKSDPGMPSKLQIQRLLEDQFLKDDSCVANNSDNNDVDWSRCGPLREYYAMKDYETDYQSRDQDELGRTVLLAQGYVNMDEYRRWLKAIYQLEVK